MATVFSESMRSRKPPCPSVSFSATRRMGCSRRMSPESLMPSLRLVLLSSQSPTTATNQPVNVKMTQKPTFCVGISFRCRQMTQPIKPKIAPPIRPSQDLLGEVAGKGRLLKNLPWRNFPTKYAPMSLMNAMTIAAIMVAREKWAQITYAPKTVRMHSSIT